MGERESDIVGLTALFQGKNGSRVGSVSGEYMERLIVVIGKAFLKAGADQVLTKKIFNALRKLCATNPDAQVMFFAKQWNPNENPRLAAAPGDPEKVKKSNPSSDPFGSSGGDDAFGDDGFGGNENPDPDDIPF